MVPDYIKINKRIKIKSNQKPDLEDDLPFEVLRPRDRWDNIHVIYSLMDHMSSVSYLWQLTGSVPTQYLTKVGDRKEVFWRVLSDLVSWTEREPVWGIEMWPIWRYTYWDVDENITWHNLTSCVVFISSIVEG